MKKFLGIISIIILSSMLHAQYVQQSLIQTATGVNGYASQGAAAAISADGNTAVVGGNYDKTGVGAVWIFVKSGGEWVQQGQKLTGTGCIGLSRFGSGVAISADGNTVVVGGSGDNNNAGAVWVFTRTGSTWSQQGGKLTGTGSIGTYCYQGQSVAVSDDGNTLVFGGSGDNGSIGAAWVFTRTGGTWTQQGSKLTGTGYIGAPQMGCSVAITSDGNTAFIGGRYDNNIGAVWVFMRTGNSWAQLETKLLPSSPTNNSGFGNTIGVSDDGNTAVVGSLNGDVWAFVRSGSTWIQQGLAWTLNGAVGQSSNSVALSSDGNTAVISKSFDDGGKGAVWIFVRSGNEWSQQGSKLTIPNSSPSDCFGYGVSISSDCNTMLAGSPCYMNSFGGAWFFTRSGSVWSLSGNRIFGSGSEGGIELGLAAALSGDGNTAVLTAFDRQKYSTVLVVYTSSNGVLSQQNAVLECTDNVGNSGMGSSLDISNDGTTIIAGGMADNGYLGAAWVFTRTGGVWSQQAKLVGMDAVGSSWQGFSVAISDDGNTAAVGGIGDNSFTGAVWIFKRTGGVWTQEGDKLAPTDFTGNPQHGSALDLSSDGNTLLIGSPFDAFGVGAAWVYTKTGGVWRQQGKLAGSGGSWPNQGCAVALSGDGNTAVLGGKGDSGKGAVWVFTRSGETWTQQGNKITASDEIGNANFGIKVAVSGNGNTIAAAGPNNDNNKGAVWFYSRSGSEWNPLGSKFAGTDNAFVGFGLGMSSDGNTILTSSHMFNNQSGAGWILKRNYNITASADINGTISPSGVTTVLSGTSATYTVQPDAGYSVQDVLVDGASVGAVTTYTFTNVTADHTISAVFTEFVDNGITVPVITYPTGGIMVYTNSPIINWYTLKWMPSLKYRVQVASDAAFSTVVFDHTNISAQYTFLSGLSSGTQYYARVRGVTASGSIGAWSQPAVFRTVTAPGQVPLVPTLVYPAGGSSVLTDQPVIVWYISAYGPGLKYNLQLSTTADFSNIVVNALGITNTTYNASGLSAGSTYYARVRSYTPQGLYSAFSSAESFTVNQLYGTQAITPVITYPSGGSTVFAASFAMTWAVPGYAPSQTLHLQVSTRSDFATLVVNQENLTGSSYILNGLVYGTTYYARIRGKSQSGSYSLFSDIVPFTVVSENWLVSPITGSPVEEVELTTSKALLSWYTPSAEASPRVRYDLQVSSNAGFDQAQNITGIISPSYELAGLKGSTKYYWRVRSRNEDGKISPYSAEGIFVTAKELKITDVALNADNVPREYALRQNYPNPFNPVTTIEFSMKSNAHAKLEVIDMLGRGAVTLVDEYLNAGTYTVKLNAQNMPSGIYFYKLTAPGVNIIRKMILSK